MRFRLVATVFGASALICALFARPARAEVCAADVLVTAPRFPVGGTPEGTLAGDFNNDGWPDVLTIASQGLTVLLGDGAGGFGPPITSPSSARLPMVQGFFDDDENLDIVSTYGSSVVVQLGSGDGTFTDEVFYAGADDPADMHVGHFNGDLFLDIVQSDNDTGNLYVLPGDGDGTFQTAIGSSAGLSRSITVGDFTGDGKLDAIGTVLFSSDAHLAPGNGDGTFGPPITVPFGHEIGPLTAADFNADGKLDLAAGYDTVVALLRGNGNGTFQPALETALPSDRSASALLPVDWDADGDLDLAVSQTSSLLPFLQQPGGTFSIGRGYLLEGGPIATGDFDDDGLPDFAMAYYYEEAIILLRSLGVGDYAAPRSVPVDLAPRDIGVGDFDSDGDDDLAVLGSHFDSQIAIVRNEGGTFRTANTFGGGNHLLVADFDTDGALDIATISFSGVIVYRGLGDGTFENVGGVPLIAGLNLAAADYDGDGILDLALVAGGSSDGELTILLGLGDATFTALPPVFLAPPASDLIGADFDEDGAADLILTVGGCCNGAFSIQFLRSNGDGTFQSPVPYFAGPAPFLPRAGDFDGDGHLDLLVASADSSNVAMFLGDGTGAFETTGLVATGWPPTDLATGDFDADGYLDFVTANGQHSVPGDSISVLLGTGHGTFLAPQEYPTPASPLAVGFGSLGPGGGRAIAVGSDDAWAVTIFGEAVLSVGSIENMSVTVDDSATLTVPAEGRGELTFVWRKDGLPLEDGGRVSGTHTSVLRIDPAAFADAGSYEVEVADSCGASVTLAASLSVEFADVSPSSPFHDDILAIATAGITGGCGGGNFCPASPVRRDQMAVFLLKAEHGAGYSAPPCGGSFSDVPCPGTYAAWIEALAAEGITGGCGAGVYCPGDSVTRAQMAVFLLKTLEGATYLPPAATGVFSDVPPGAFAADFIEDLYGRGVTGGCSASPLLYCPDGPVLRRQMATLLARTFLP